MRTRTFDVFKGSTKWLLYTVTDSDGNIIDAGSVGVKLYDQNMTYLTDILAVRTPTNTFQVSIDTKALNLNAGKYIIEFSCIANGNNYCRRDFLIVNNLL